MSDVKKGVVIDLNVAILIRDVFLPMNERRMRKAHPSVVAAVTAFKNAVRDRLQADATDAAIKAGR